MMGMVINHGYVWFTFQTLFSEKMCVCQASVLSENQVLEILLNMNGTIRSISIKILTKTTSIQNFLSKYIKPSFVEPPTK